MIISRLNRRRLVRMAKKILSSEELTEQYAHGRGSRGGCYNRFFKLTENWAVKIGSVGRGTVGNYYRQRRAWRCGCGPFCFGLMYVSHLEDYAFITEVVTVFDEVAQCSYRRNRKEEHVFKHLQRKMEIKIGFRFGDSANRNIGIRGSIMVCIDFDDI